MAYRTNLSLDDAGKAALMRIPRYERSKTIRRLLLNLNPQSNLTMRLKTNLALIDEKMYYSKACLYLARELDEIEKEEGRLNSPRVERLYTIALKACFLYEETKSKAANDVLKRTLSLYKEFSGIRLSIKQTSTELKLLLAKDEKKRRKK